MRRSRHPGEKGRTKRPSDFGQAGPSGAWRKKRPGCASAARSFSVVEGECPRVRSTRVAEKRIGPARGELAGPQGGGVRCSWTPLLLCKGLQAVQAEKEGSLSLAEPIIKVDLEEHMSCTCSFCRHGGFEYDDSVTTTCWRSRKQMRTRRAWAEKRIGPGRGELRRATRRG